MCDEDIFCVYSDNIDDPPENGQIIITRGEITRGFEYPMQRLAIIGDRDMFGRDKSPQGRLCEKAMKAVRLDGFEHRRLCGSSKPWYRPICGH